MGLFSSECKHCGSKEHASSDCPHDIFSSECKHCGSKEHASSDCPHGIFSSKCKHCGSIDHSSDNCPHGIFSSKCKHCGSKEHESNDCPHGIFSTKCKHCGSVNHASSDCPQGGFFSRRDSYSNSSANDDAVGWIVKIVFVIAAGAIVLYIAIIILVIALLLSPLALLILYLIQKRENKYWVIASIALSIYLFIDFSSYGVLAEMISSRNERELMKMISIGYLIVLVTGVGVYFEKYSSVNIPVSENGNFFSQKEIKKRRPLIAGLGLFLIGLYTVINFIDFSSINSSHLPSSKATQYTKPSNSSSTNNYTNTSTSTASNTSSTITTQNTTNNNTSNGTLAVISDFDGFTNLRQGKGSNFTVLKKIKANEKFTVFPTTEKWWKVQTQDGTVGYIFHDRVDLLNKEFYIINVTATKTETKALSEVKKLKNKGYEAGHLWIPNYKSLSGANLYSVYIGPFSSQHECAVAIENYRKINKNAYGTLVSQKNKRVEIRGVNKINSNEYKTGYINGTNVIIRANHTTQSKILGSFKKSGEKLTIIDTYFVKNSSETLINNDISVHANGRMYKLIKGKAVTVTSLNGNTARITFKDKNLNKITTTISKNFLERINNNLWYKIKRNSGEIGWVYGKFIIEN